VVWGGGGVSFIFAIIMILRDGLVLKERGGANHSQLSSYAPPLQEHRSYKAK